MFEKFDDDARQVILNAQNEARVLRHPLVGTSHLVLSIAARRDTEPALILQEQGIGYNDICFHVIEAAGLQEARVSVHIPHTSEFRDVLEGARSEADEYGGSHVSTLHVLSAVLTQKNGTAHKVITALGADPRAIVARIRRTYQRT